jgi:hypothetical protein
MVMPTPIFRLALLTGLVISFASGAQDTMDEPTEELSIRKGKVLLGSYFSFSASTVEKTRASGLSTDSDVIAAGINITGGKMISDHWGLLMVAGYRQSSSSTPINVGTVSTVFEDTREDYIISPAIRYYKLISDATYFFVQGNIFVSRGSSSTDEFDGTQKVTINLSTQGFGFGISPGFSYFMTDKLSTEISIGILGYSILKGEDDQGNKTIARTFQSLLYLNSVSLGFVYYLR